MASFTAAGTSYATHGEPMIPFYIFYSMFGFQRIGDLDLGLRRRARARASCSAPPPGRTTLNGEGLQHQDGHSRVLASAIPNLLAYDPAFAYEMAVIIRDGLRAHVPQAARTSSTTSRSTTRTTPCRRCPRARRTGILRGMYRFRPGRRRARSARSSSAAASILREALRAQEMLAEQLRRGGRRLERDDLPAAAQRGARGRALEPAAPARGAARALRDGHARRRAGPGRSRRPTT